jgi:hypothetical protein
MCKLYWATWLVLNYFCPCWCNTKQINRTSDLWHVGVDFELHKLASQINDACCREWRVRAGQIAENQVSTSDWKHFSA